MARSKLHHAYASIHRKELNESLWWGWALHCYQSQFTSVTLLSLRENSLPAKHRDAVTFASTVEPRPHPLECDWPLSCVFKATGRKWKLYQWKNSPPLRWRIWSQAPRTTWGFTPMSSTASAVLSSLRPKQVRPHLARWDRGSSQVGYSGCKSVRFSDSDKAVCVVTVCFLITCMFSKGTFHSFIFGWTWLNNI